MSNTVVMCCFLGNCVMFFMTITLVHSCFCELRDEIRKLRTEIGHLGISKSSIDPRFDPRFMTADRGIDIQDALEQQAEDIEKLNIK